MRKFFPLFLMVPLLLISVFLYAGGPKEPITAETIGGSGATINVTLCAQSSLVPCTSSTFTCPPIIISGPDLITKTSCGPAGFKITNYQYTITTSAGGCFGSALEGYTVNCNALSDGSSVLLKAGHGKFP